MLDDQIQQDFGKVLPGEQYLELASLVPRQTFGALDITAPQPDESTRFFMRDIGISRSVTYPLSFGFASQFFSSRVNPVEVLYASLPARLYFNASLVMPLLLPLLEQQNGSLYQFSASDIGQFSPPTESFFIHQCVL